MKLNTFLLSLICISIFCLCKENETNSQPKVKTVVSKYDTALTLSKELDPLDYEIDSCSPNNNTFFNYENDMITFLFNYRAMWCQINPYKVFIKNNTITIIESYYDCVKSVRRYGVCGKIKIPAKNEYRVIVKKQKRDGSDERIYFDNFILNSNLNNTNIISKKSVRSKTLEHNIKTYRWIPRSPQNSTGNSFVLKEDTIKFKYLINSIKFEVESFEAIQENNTVNIIINSNKSENTPMLFHIAGTIMVSPKDEYRIIIKRKKQTYHHEWIFFDEIVKKIE